jgi:hypothetical protein
VKYLLALLLISGAAWAGIPDGSSAANGKVIFSCTINDMSIQSMASQGEVYRKVGDHSEIFVAFKHSNNTTNLTPNLTILTEDRYAAGFLYSVSPKFSGKVGYINLRINGMTYGASGFELIRRF